MIRIIPLFFLILFLGCVKEQEDFSPYENDLGRVEALVGLVNKKTEVSTFDNASGAVIVSTGGIVLDVPPGGFQLPNKEIYEGQVKLKFNFIDNAKTAAINGINTVHNGRLLQPDLLYYIQGFSEEDEPLIINGDKVIQVNHPALLNNIDHMDHFFQNISGDGSNMWDVATLPEYLSIYYGNWEKDTPIGKVFGTGYTFDIKKSGWQGIGSFEDSTPIFTSQLCVTLPQLFNKRNSVVYLLQKDKLSVVNLQAFDTMSKTFCSNIKVTAGDSFEVISLSSTENNEFYLGRGILNATNNFIDNIIPQKTSIKEITIALLEK